MLSCDYCICSQDVLGSIGGVELLFPILEQVHIPLKRFSGQGHSEEAGLDMMSHGRASTFHGNTVM